jgi:hypothetical protein
VSVTLAYEVDGEVQAIPVPPAPPALPESMASRVSRVEALALALCDLLRDTGSGRADTLEHARVHLMQGFVLLRGALADMSPLDTLRVPR